MHDTLVALPQCSFAFAQHEKFLDPGTPVFSLDDPSVKIKDPWDQYPRYGFGGTPSASLFRRDIVRAAGGWDPRHEGMSDHSLWLRTALWGPAARYNGKTVAYRQHRTSHTQTLCKSPEKYITLMLAVSDDLLQSFLTSSTDEDRRCLMQRRNSYLHDAADAALALRSGDTFALKTAFARLDNAYAQESGIYRAGIIYTLFAMLLFSPERIKPETYYLALLNAYPGSRSMSKKILVRALNECRPDISLYLKYYLLRPWEPVRLYPFATWIDEHLHRPRS